MTTKNFNYSLFALLASLLLVIAVSCTRDIDLLEPATYPKTPEVFIDGFSAGLNYAAFGGSKVTAFDVDTEVKYSGTASMKFAVPDFEDPEGAYAGGAYFTTTGRDLSGYDALTFWVKASKAATIDVLGFGNDLDELKYVTTLLGIKVNTNWKKYIIPIPDPSKLTAERGMFFYSEGPEDGSGYTFWIDEVKFEKLGTIAHPRPAILEEQSQVVSAETGEELRIGGTFAVYNMPSGIDQRIEVAPSYFSFTSSDPTVANVNERGIVTVIDSGNAVITAKLGNNDSKGSLTVEAVGALAKPSAPAPVPTRSQESVISLFSNVYSNVPVDTWNPFWQYSTAEVKDLQISGDDVKLYKKLNFVGIEFTSQTINASNMTHFHIDIWTPDPADAAEFEAKLVDFGADGVFGGNNDFEKGVKITSPILVSKTWIGVDIPLSGFASKAHMAQLILVGNENLNNLYIDNVYFYNDGSGGGGNGTAPTDAAPTPTANPVNVVSLFSNAYTNVPVDTWSADWDAADVADVQIKGNDTKLYTNLVFAGIEFTSQTVDASSMSRFHMDIWTPDETSLPAVIKIKLVDFGANGTYDGGGDDAEHEITLNATTSPALATGSWVNINLPLSEFTGLTTKGHLAQLIISGDPNTIYVDNIYFSKDTGGGGATEPTQAALNPPVREASDVVSIFSEAYTNIDGTEFFPNWGQTTIVTTVNIVGNSTLKYENFNYQGTQFATSQDLSSMEYLHIDLWTSDATVVKVTPINGSGSPSENLVSLSPIVSEQWNSFDIPLSDFTNSGMLLNEVIQIKFDGQEGKTPSNIYLDNIYFYKSGSGSGGSEPTQAAPTPSFAASNVISLFSNAYSNVKVDTWSADWDAADIADVQVAGDDVKLYTNLVFAGIEFTSQTIDATSMTHFYMDIWTPDQTDAPKVFKVKLVDFGANGVYDGGGDDVEHELFLNNTTTPAMGTGKWVKLDIPLSDFAGLTTKGHMAQLIISGDPNTVYVDNILFHK